MPIIGKPRSYFKKFSFTIEEAGITSAAFQACSELSAETASIEQWEGGALTADKSPGRTTFSDVTLSRGATKSLDLYNWFREVSNAASNTGQVDDQYKRTLDIVQRDRDGTVLRRWTLHEAWPKKFVAGDWDNTADANVMESVTLAYRYFEPDDA